MATTEEILNKVESLRKLWPSWKAWREARKVFGYGPTYKAYLTTPEWKEFRDKKIDQTPFCECCGEPDACEVHHLSYRYVYFENMGLCQAVCEDCHQAMTGIDNYEKKERQNVDRSLQN